MMLYKAWLGLGSNIGDKAAWLDLAAEKIAAHPQIEIVKISSLYQTAPWGVEEQEDYLNAVIEISTDLPPFDLLSAMQSIEDMSGRQRPYRWAPRQLDIDILLYDDMISREPELILPHPRMKERLFVLWPLYEIAGNITFPDGEKLLPLLEQAQKDQQAKIVCPAEKWEKGKKVCRSSPLSKK